MAYISTCMHQPFRSFSFVSIHPSAVFPSKCPPSSPVQKLMILSSGTRKGREEGQMIGLGVRREEKKLNKPLLTPFPRPSRKEEKKQSLLARTPPVPEILAHAEAQKTANVISPSLPYPSIHQSMHPIPNLRHTHIPRLLFSTQTQPDSPSPAPPPTVSPAPPDVDADCYRTY